MYCSLDKLEVEDGLPPNHTKADATRWGSCVPWEHMKEVVQPALQQRPLMAVRGGPGDKLEVSMDLTWDQVRSVVCSSGKYARVGYWMGRPAPGPLEITTVWVNLPQRECTPMLWAKLQGGGGLVCGHTLQGPPWACWGHSMGTGAGVQRDTPKNIHKAGCGSAAAQDGGPCVWIWPKLRAECERRQTHMLSRRCAECGPLAT